MQMNEETMALGTESLCLCLSTGDLLEEQGVDCFTGDFETMGAL